MLQRSIEQQCEYAILLNRALRCFVKMVDLTWCFLPQWKSDMMEHDTQVHKTFQPLRVIFKVAGLKS